jgi:outer membrane protein assembly factor BamB
MRILKTLVLLLILLSAVYVESTTLAIQSTSSPSNDDWPMFQHNPAHTGYFTGTLAANLTVAWTFRPNASHGFFGHVPAVANGSLYITDENYLYCINALNGNLRWKQNLTVQEPLSKDEFSTAIYNGFVYTDNAAYNASTGKLLFNYAVSGSGSPTVVDGVVFMGVKTGGLMALNATSGAILWEKSGETMFFSPAVKEGIVYYSYGFVFWQHGDSCYAVNAATGNQIWNVTGVGGPYAHVMVAEGNVYLNGYGGVFYCLNASTGAIVWSYPAYVGQQLISPAVADGRVYAGQYVLNASTGTPLWNSSILTGSSPAITNGVVFVSYNRGLYALNASTGDEIWSYRFQGKYKYDLNSSPVITNGMVYICADDGKELYAFGAPTSSVDATTPLASIYVYLLFIVLVILAILLTIVLIHRKNKRIKRYRD